MIRSVVENKRTAVSSGHSVGKSWLSAKLALTFLILHYPSKVVTTAPTWFQIEKILWSEIRSSHAKARFPIGGTLLQMELRLEEDWFAVGLSTTEGVATREFGAVKMQGFHSPNLLVILDEAPGVPREIWRAVESLITGDNNKVLAIGNPTSPSGDFFECFKSPLWSTMYISCLDHPNVVSGQELIPGCVTRSWVEDRKTAWGEDSPLYRAKVLGQFPDEGEDTLFPLSWVEDAAKRVLSPLGTRRLGGDIARFGPDRTVLYEITGQVAKLKDSAKKQDTMVTAGKIKNLIEEHLPDCYIGEDGKKLDDCKYDDYHYDHVGIDDAGVGGGVSDRLVEQDVSIDRVNFGESAIESERFINVRAEAYWILRDALNPKSTDPLQIEDDDDLLHELTNIKFSFTSKGQIKIESKDEIKKRIGRSPDKADALAIAYYAGRKHKDPQIHII